MTEYKIGDKVRYLGGDLDGDNDLTIGKIYEINFDEDLDAYIRDDADEMWHISWDDVQYYELVTEPSEPTPVEASPTVIELLANISRRLYAVERHIAMQRRENELAYENASELERQNREQAYEINELYKAVADRG